MCGFAGVLQLDGQSVARPVLERMRRTLRHRGPDDSGIYAADCVGLAHTRLSIIDLTAGSRQPMTSADGGSVLTYNGELYNFRALREELRAEGYQFKSEGDTEVVLAALECWGVAALQRFNGMFSLAFYDTRERQLLLARDRYGVKPLYWTWTGRRVVFGSEIKALLEHPRVRPELDERGLAEYLSYQNFLGAGTLFEGIDIVPPGSYLRIRADAARPSPVQYWDYDFREPEEHQAPQEYVEELDRLFEQAVKRQLVADVPVSAYLSGGMDTGAIAAIASRERDHMRTFTIGFDTSSCSGLELGFDERAQAERMSALCRTEQYEMVLKAGDMERAMRQLVWHMEEPRVGQSYPNFYAAKLAAAFDKVVLSGAGGDELFAGYPWRYYHAAGSSDFEHYLQSYLAYWQRIVPSDRLGQLIVRSGDEAEEVARTRFRAVFSKVPEGLLSPEDYINQSLYFEAKTFLHGLLVVEDKLSMAHGLEVRVPFLDNDLVDFAQRVPVGLKLANIGRVPLKLDENESGPKPTKYYERTRDGKLLLREVMRRYVPDDVADGVKQGFSGPDATWFRGESMAYVRRTLLGRDAHIFEWLDRQTVHELVSSHMSGRENRRLLIWALLCLEQWCEIYLNGNRPEV